MRYNPWLPASLVGAAIVMVAQPVRAEFLLPTQVAEIAKSTVVRIEPTIAAPGSGVLIGKEQRGREYIYTSWRERR